MLKTLTLLAALILFACISGCGDSMDTNSIVNPPELKGLDPAANDGSVLAGSAITATFDKEMGTATDRSFVVYGIQSGKLSGTYAGFFSDTLSFDAANPFKTGEEIEVILTRLLNSIYGVSLRSPVVYRFRIETLGGTGDFTAADTVAGQTGVVALAAGDWDGDRDLDLAAANFLANRVDILENDSTGDFTAADTVADQDRVRALAAGDWDGDDDLDLAAANNLIDTVGVLENQN